MGFSLSWLFMLQNLSNQFQQSFARLQQILDPGQDQFSVSRTILLILVAYAFGACCRLFYLWNALDTPQVLLDGFPMIGTEDGYLFADYVKAHLQQDFSRHQIYLLAPQGHGAITLFTYLFVKLLPYSIEQVAVFMPVIIAPLLAVPMVLTGRWLGNTTMGFLAAVLAVVFLPYMRRTPFSYFDTELFALTAPAMLVAVGIYVIRNPGLLQVALLCAMTILTMWLDKYVVAVAMHITIAIVFVIANFRHPRIYEMLILLCVPLLAKYPGGKLIALDKPAGARYPIRWFNYPWYGLLVVEGVVLGFLALASRFLPLQSASGVGASSSQGASAEQTSQNLLQSASGDGDLSSQGASAEQTSQNLLQSAFGDGDSSSSSSSSSSGSGLSVSPARQQLHLRVWQILAALAVGWVFVQSPLFEEIRKYFLLYGSAGEGIAQANPERWHFFQVTGTISEGFQLGLRHFATESGGSVILFALAFGGAIMALLRFPVLAAGGIFVTIGFYALEGGIRFVIYFTPILAIGGAFLALLVARHLHRLKHLNRVKYANYALAFVFVAIFAYPGVRLAYNFKPRSVALAPQVQLLQHAAKVSESQDYIISWWDYGYLMGYYAEMRTIIDGGKHQNDNYLVSKVFSAPSQRLAANLLRESVEIHEQRGRQGVIVNRLLHREEVGTNPHRFIEGMAATDYVLRRPKTREIFLYMPAQMIPLYSLMRKFSDLSLVTGKQFDVPLRIYRIHRHPKEDQQRQRLLLPDRIELDLRQGLVLQGGRAVGQINSYYTDRLDAKHQSQMQETSFHSSGTYYVIQSDFYGVVYLMGPKAFRSNFVQWFFFNNYDPALFELVGRDPLATIYRLKI